MTGKRSSNIPAAGSPPSDTTSSSPLKEQERLLPIANVSRIMKRSLPTNAKISKEAKETVQECVSEFISFITGEASDKCQREKRKTISGDDLLWAMTMLGFDNYVAPLKVYLNNYRDSEEHNNNNNNNSAAQELHSPVVVVSGGLNHYVNKSDLSLPINPDFSGGFYSLGRRS